LAISTTLLTAEFRWLKSDTNAPNIKIQLVLLHYTTRTLGLEFHKQRGEKRNKRQTGKI
jgi:hypothetical protein